MNQKTMRIVIIASLLLVVIIGLLFVGLWQTNYWVNKKNREVYYNEPWNVNPHGTKALTDVSLTENADKEVPGTVIAYLSKNDDTFDYSGQYLCSPSIARLSDGTLYASHDIYENGIGNQNLTKIYRSVDDGESWNFVCDLYPCCWGKLFVVNDILYMVGTSTECGDLLVGRTLDGENWSKPTMVLKGGNRLTGGVHKAPNPVLITDGKIYIPIEYGSWIIGGHRAGFVTADANADLLNADNYTVSNFIKYTKNFDGAVQGGDNPDWLEGNIVQKRDGELVNFMRYNTVGSNEPYGKAVMHNIDNENNTISVGKPVKFIGNMTKFDIIYDAATDKYLSLVNKVTNGNPNQRNVLTLVSSSDLESWCDNGDILNYEDNGWAERDDKAAFQYVDFIIVGKDIYFVSRTALNGADSYHNSNYITFHKIPDYAELLKTSK